MLAAALYNSTSYKLMLFVHILSVIVAFAPSFVWPFVAVRLKKENKPVGPTIGSLAAGNTTKIYGPALVVAGVVGCGLVGMSTLGETVDPLYSFADAWVSAALLVWFLLMGVLFGMMLPAEKKAAAGDASAEKLSSMAGGIIHLLLAAELLIMVFQPSF
jgi:uncharacterized membrane protein